MNTLFPPSADMSTVKLCALNPSKQRRDQPLYVFWLDYPSSQEQIFFYSRVYIVEAYIGEHQFFKPNGIRPVKDGHIARKHIPSNTIFDNHFYAFNSHPSRDNCAWFE